MKYGFDDCNRVLCLSVFSEQDGINANDAQVEGPVGVLIRIIVALGIVGDLGEKPAARFGMCKIAAIPNCNTGARGQETFYRRSPEDVVPLKLMLRA